MENHSVAHDASILTITSIAEYPNHGIAFPFPSVEPQVSVSKNQFGCSTNKKLAHGTLEKYQGILNLNERTALYSSFEFSVATIAL